RTNAAHAPAARECCARDAEVGAAEHIARVEELEAIARVRAIDAESLHRLGIAHAPEARRRSGTRLLPERGDQPFAQPHDVLLRDERGLDVDLRELRLTVDTQIFVAKASRDLKVAVEAGHHEQLLIELRRLRQRIE